MELYCTYCHQADDEETFEMVPSLRDPGARVPMCRAWIRCYLRAARHFWGRPR